MNWQWLAVVFALVYAPVAQRRMADRPEWPVLFGLPNLMAMMVAGNVLLAFLAAFGNPLVAGGLAIAILLGLPLLDRAKRTTLHEPIVLMDAWLLRQIFRFPKFYFPYLPTKRLLALALGTAGLIVAYYYFRPMHYIPASYRRIAILMALLAPMLLILAAGCLDARWRRWFPVSANPAVDVRRYGLIGSTLLQGVWLLTSRSLGRRRVAPDQFGLSSGCPWPRAKPAGVMPHVVMVQAESYVHLRRVRPGLPAVWTRNFDALAAEGTSGPLAVKTFGAYTIRTEFSALTGLNREALEVDGINPYLLASRVPTGSLARYFAQRGYDTVCLHPNDRRFFRRRRVMPRMGFDRFLAGEDFVGAERYGPYVSDRALGERILATLDGERPTFAFAITIEAHGPWHKGQLKDDPWPAAEPFPGELRAKDGSLDGGVAAYARHLRKTDEFLGQLADALRRLERPSVLAVYGDHPGAIAGTEGADGREEPMTDFLIWRHPACPRAGTGLAPETLLTPAELGGLVIRACAGTL